MDGGVLRTPGRERREGAAASGRKPARSRTARQTDRPLTKTQRNKRDNMARLVLENGVTSVVHLATLLSAVGERNPALALKVNIHGAQVGDWGGGEWGNGGGGG